MKAMDNRKNITQPVEWWAAFARAAKADGKTLSEWIGDACKAQLPKNEQKTLPSRAPANRPKKT